jgi:hypothetical protein
MMRGILLFILFLSLSTGSFAQTDLSILDSATGCTSAFFKRAEKPASLDKIVLVNKAGKALKMPAYLEKEGIGGFGEYGLADLDYDGKMELVISNFTNGAHCCDEFYFFRNMGNNRYQLAARTSAGNICINERDDFIYDFYEQLGYFFTCYACSYTDTTDAAPLPVQHIKIRYIKGKLNVLPGDKELKAEILDNLEKLAEQPFVKLAETSDQDNGLRKEFALNLMVYYYSFGKNLAETKKLFDKYYKFPDAKLVWTEFNKTLQGIKSRNNF